MRWEIALKTAADLRVLAEPDWEGEAAEEEEDEEEEEEDEDGAAEGGLEAADMAMCSAGDSSDKIRSAKGMWSALRGELGALGRGNDSLLVLPWIRISRLEVAVSEGDLNFEGASLHTDSLSPFVCPFPCSFLCCL